MGIMSYLRERMGKILAGVIGLALVAFIAGEVIKSGSSFFKGNVNDIGEVNGQAIAYRDFSQRLEQSTQQFKQQSGQSLTPQINNYLQETTWNTLLTQLLLNKEVDRVGIVVGEAESQAMISGNNPDPQIQRQFVDQQTGQFDKNKLNQFLQYLQTPKADPAQLAAWTDFVKQLIEAKKQQKYMALVSNGLYVNSLDAQDDYLAKNKLASFKYTTLDYASIPDSKIKLTDDDYSEYYNDHKPEFKNTQELRSFEYISFNAAPSKEDSLSVKAQVDKLLADFKATPNDSLFVQINSETKAPLVYQHKGQLDPKLDSVMFGADKGFVYGPYLAGGSYKIAKLIDARVGPDSVRARHILINPATEGGVDKAVAKADSLKKLIQGGASFADLARKFSIDGSAQKGGELPTFGRGAMIPAFEDAVFNGKKGDVKVITTQYGVHLIEIEDQKGSSKVVKVAVVDKPLAPSSKTQSAIYSKAQSFLGSLSADNFDAKAKSAGLPVKTADDVNGTAASLPGLDNARDIVKWAFKAEKGDFSDQVFAAGDQYVVAHLTQIKPEGILPLDVIKKQLEPMVKIRVKAKQLSARLQSALNGASSIDQVAQKAGSTVVPLQNIVFANPVIPGAAAEYKVVGTVFGSQPNKLSKPIEGQNGVFVTVLEGFTNPAQLTNAVREKQQMGQAILQRSQNEVLDALKDKANVKDNRAKFL
ncbi:peptidylprolyl isomerase [Inquilinus sp. KBS0705]|nr:peptidylprolyl isomerase [Inquilinus sp. KBS0705]